ncbi:ABC transporter ATP-binding protein [Brevibacillus sp. SYSU BS000544]|uniref:ABC transporter ATP-binding protein n=1 Tax=Brevibacillus sp. SYSU BS000544 TaxID=3416443 RepID=UPI003CE4EF2A
MIINVNQISWEREQSILKDVSWQVKENEHWCMVGLNGSGKTTLLNMINGYLWPTRGSIQVLGHTFGEVDLRDLRKQIGWVSSSLQQKLYGNETALDIVLSGKFASIGLYDRTDAKDREEVQELLEFLGCGKLSYRTYNTMSQGERQKILIARALIASPKLLILDEPCSGLDMFAREHLLRTIETIAHKPDAPTMIFVTHHIEEILPVFSQTLLMREGSVFHAGTTKETITSSVLSEFFGVPMVVHFQNNRYWANMEFS